MGRKLRKLAKRSGTAAGDSDLAQTVRDSAHQIWLAGLGAWGKTRAEGAKVFNALVREGKGIESHTRKLAGARVEMVTGQVGKAASEAQARASATWDKLEQVFEQRVARALHRLGVPTSKEIEALTRRVEALTASVERIGRAPELRPKKSRAASGKPRKAGAKRRSGAKRAGPAPAAPSSEAQ
ncbi:MAG: phasin family protein [Burkholderiales bacterium]|nr:phasin family protein [Burkholderiales bacterium]